MKLSAYGYQLLAVLYKNALLLRKSKLFLLVAVLFPAVVILLLGVISNSIKTGASKDAPAEFPLIKNSVGAEPIILAYPLTDYTSEILKGVARRQQLDYKGEPSGHGIDLESFSVYAFTNETEYVYQLMSYANGPVIYHAIGVRFEESSYVWNQSVHYSVVDSYDPNFYFTYSKDIQVRNVHLLSLQLSLDSAIIDAIPGGDSSESISINPVLKPFTAHKTRQDAYEILNKGIDLTTILVHIFISLAFFPLAIHAFLSIVNEKQKRLLDQYRRIGGYESVYWLSFHIPYWLLVILASLLSGIAQVIVNTYSSYHGFTNAAGGAIILVNICSGMAIVSFYIMLSSIVKRPALANTLMIIVLCYTVISIITYQLPVMTKSFKFRDPAIGVEAELVATFGCMPTDEKQGTPQAINDFIFPWSATSAAWCDITRITNGNGTFRGHFSMNDFGRSYGPFINEHDEAVYTSSLATKCGLMFSTALIFYVLGWYLAQVLSGEDGLRRPFWFVFLPSYWGLEIKKDPLFEGDTLGALKEKSRQDQSIILHKLSKSFKQVSALKELSLELNVGKIYGLLGQNGAGKSTIVNILSGLMSPSHGNAFLFGHSITTEVNAVQSIIGVCSQDDILWDDLNGRDHVWVYGLIRGQFLKKHDIDNHLDQVGLGSSSGDSVKSTKEYSGGMKRRLSLLLSTIGNDHVKLFLLDEPTTGVDPLNRRYSWNLIKNMKRNRIVVLTTHSMEEADALSDYIEIMHNGQLKASGTSLFLKNRFGNGYQLTITLAHSPETLEDDKISILSNIITKMMPEAEILKNAGNLLMVGIKQSLIKKLPSLLRKLELEVPGSDWGISNATLEQVFMKLVDINTTVNSTTEGEFDQKEEDQTVYCSLCTKRQAEVVQLFTKGGVSVYVSGVLCKACAENANGADSDPEQIETLVVQDPEDANDVLDSEDSVVLKPLEVPNAFNEHGETHSNTIIENSNKVSKVDRRKTSFLSQTKAIIMKNFTLQSKQRCSNVIIILLAIACYILLAVFLGENRTKTISSKMCSHGKWPKSRFSQDSTDYCDASKIVTLLNEKYYSTCSSKNDDVVVDDKRFCINSDFITYPVGQYERFVFRNCSYNNYYPYCNSIKDRGKIFYHDASGAFTRAYDNYGKKEVLYNEKNVVLGMRNIDKSVDDIVFKSQIEGSLETHEKSTCTKFYGIPANHTESKTPVKDLIENYPEYGLEFIEFTKEKISVNILDYSGTYPFVGFYVSGDKSCQKYGVSASSWPGEDHYFSVMSSLTTLLYREKMNSPHVSIYPSYHSFAAYSSGVIGRIQELSWREYKGPELSLFFLVTFTMLASFLFFPFFCNTLVMERQSRLFDSMKIQGLKAPAYWFGNYLYFMTCSMILNILSMILLYSMDLGEIRHVSVGWTFLLFLVWSHSQVGQASLLTSLLLKRPKTAFIMSFLYALGCSLGIGLAVLFSGYTSFASESAFFTPIAFALSISRVFEGVIDTYFHLLVLGYLLACGTVYLAVGIYLHHTISSTEEGSFADGILFFVPKVIRKFVYGIFVGLYRKLFSSTHSSYFMVSNEEDEHSSILNEDKDVIAERNRVLESSHKFAIKILHLTKYFNLPNGTKKKVLKDLSLGLDFGECFGLLGLNGCGKSTLLNMITGMLDSNGGLIRIAGQSLGNIVNDIHQYIAICPQFDYVWDEMTVEEHLIFFARLRGCPGRELKAWVQKAAEQVKLDGDAFHLKASKLSGGMRRRLSIAISLIGDCPILLLDEPSTGLDINNRAQIWKIIDSLKDGSRLVVMTTHSLEEADALATRIGVLADGGLKCIGTQLHLKNRFGDGYLLSFRVQAHALADILEENTTGASSCSDDRITAIERAILQELTSFVRNDLFATAECVSKHKDAHGFESSMVFDTTTQIIESTRSAPTYHSAVTKSSQSSICSWMFTAYFRISMDSRGKLGDIFIKCDNLVSKDRTMNLRRITEEGHEHNVVSWGLNQPSLEDVFLKVTK